MHCFRFQHFPKHISHGVFARHGGCSAGEFTSLNVGLHVGDMRENVYTNRERIKGCLDLEALFSAKQIHQDKIAIVDSSKPESELDGFDALITKTPGVGLMIQQADCQAVLLHDPVKDVIANIHSGWRGSVQNIIAKTVVAMQERFGCDPADMLAGISPSLGPCCAEFNNYQDELPPHFHSYEVGERKFDFWAISQDQLCSAGLMRANIEIAGTCTVCDPNYFSYRREGTTGRFASVIALS